MGELAAFYVDTLGMPCVERSPQRLAVQVGETRLRFDAAPGNPFAHVALLAPGNRFAAAVDWVTEWVDLLPDPQTGSVLFDFEDWNAQACYFHDPAGNIVEVIAHRDIGLSESFGGFAASEFLGVSEVGLVGDGPSFTQELERELGLLVWDGGTNDPTRLAFVGEKGRTLILCPAGRPWLPTARPAEAHPVEVVLDGLPEGEVTRPAGGCVRRGRRYFA